MIFSSYISMATKPIAFNEGAIEFLTGNAQMKVEEALHFFQSGDFLKSRDYENPSPGKDENPDVK